MSLLHDIHFIRPVWLAALLPLAAILLLYWRRRAGAAIWRKLVDAHLLPHLLVGEGGGPKRLPLILTALGWTLLVLALAGPVWSKLPTPVFGTKAQRAILLDLSPSMNAADVAPSRLARARFEVLDLLKASQEGEVALLAFGPEPFVVSPLSGDAKTIAEQVPQLTTDLIPVPGPRRTDLALKQTGEMLRRAQASHADIILVTDGLGDRAASLEAARALAAQGDRLSVLAVGTAKGAPVPGASGGFVKNEDGSIQIARLDADALRELARVGGGRYVAASVGDQDTRALTQDGPRLDQTVEETNLTADRWREEGPWLLLLLLPLAAVAFRRGWLLPVIAVVLILPARPSLAIGWSDLWWTPDQQGARQLATGQAKDAAQTFEDPAWRAAASYRAGDFETALKQTSGLDGAEADYNRGNALARLGRLEDAADAYRKTLKQAPGHADAKHNLELVERLLEQQKQQQKKDQQKDSQGQDDEKQGQDQESSSQQDKNGEGDQKASSPPQGGSDSQKDQSDQKAGGDQKGDGSDQQNADGASQPQASGGQSQQDTKSGAGETSEAGQDETSADGREAAAKEEKNSDPNQSSQAGSSPNAGDFSQEALSSGTDQPEAKQDENRAASLHGIEPQGDSGSKDTATPGIESLSPEEREQQQAMEAQLRRVPDDPAGLIRQRFLLQHLRREGRLP